MQVPIITFLSDYGLVDDFVGVCHGVIAGICPRARVIDLTHGIPRHGVRAGALVLEATLPYLPVGVHLAVVDPGVGGERRALALRLADDRMLVGPDNGLLSLAASEGGGVLEAVDIGHSRFALEPVSTTFHGRDIFAPVAARLASGAALADAGEPCDADALVRLELPRPRRGDEGVLIAHATYVDRFGNVALNVGRDELGGSGSAGDRIEIVPGSGEPHQARLVTTFADVGPGELLVYEDSYRRLAVAVNGGDAATRLGLGADDELRMRLT
jgi:S-adenosyl-L-methionine hydrolase (adenosine-forming)